MDKARITHVLEKLGSERVERGLPAFHDTTDPINVWTTCFLGRALHITQADINQRCLPRKLAGLEGYGDVTDAFDSERVRPKLHALILEWLEANRVPQEAPHVPVSGVPLPV